MGETVEQTMSDELREQLAAYAHEAWAGWMKYLFSQCQAKGVNTRNDPHVETLIIPNWAVTRWQRQMTTPYFLLPESEKESDREQADKMLAIVAPAPPALPPEDELREAVAIVIGRRGDGSRQSILDACGYLEDWLLQTNPGHSQDAGNE